MRVGQAQLRGLSDAAAGPEVIRRHPAGHELTGTASVGTGPKVGLAGEVIASLAAGLLVGLMLASDVAVTALALGTWALSAYHRGWTVMSPSRAQIRSLLHSAAFALALVAIGVGLRVIEAAAVADTVVAVAVSTVVAGGVRFARRRRRGAVRTLIVGDRVGIAELCARWGNSRDVQVVGCCIVEPDLGPEDYPATIMGVSPIGSVTDVPAAVERLRAHNVIVAPGPGFTSDDFRELAWSLERSTVALGLVDVLASVAPHRVSPGTMAGTLVMDVAPPRQSAWSRLVKEGVDRLCGALLLLVAAPLLGGLWLAVRLDTSGPGFFTQQRVGRDGKLFTMYKLRTMVQDAEAIKQTLLDDNEGDGLLFKMRADPRITRVGRLLRRTSLDELPQLINVVRGEMSLVGPRPALPDEVAQYDGTTRRRLATRPGLTGLWQVSGRSDLPWKEAVALDLHYVDNWRLSDDALIGFRTVGAVLGSRGAY